MVKVFRKMKTGRRRFGRNRSLQTANGSPVSDCIETASVPSLDEQSSTMSTRSVEYLPSLLGPQDSLATTDDNSSLYSLSIAHSDDYDLENDTSSGVSVSMVVYNPAPQPSLPDSWNTWVKNVDALLHSKEMNALMGSSQEVVAAAIFSGKHAVASAGGMVVHIALLPVKVPLHVASATTNIVVGVAGNVIQKVTRSDSTSGEDSSSGTPIQGLVHIVCNAIPFVLSTGGRLTGEVRSAAIRAVTPARGLGKRADQGSNHSRRGYQTASGQSSAQEDTFLDKLRLDVHLPSQNSDKESTKNPMKTKLKEAPCYASNKRPASPPAQPAESAFTRATPSDISKHLLRVDDLNVLVSPDPAADDTAQAQRALYIDLGKEFGDDSVTNDALKQLMKRGLDVCRTNPESILHLDNCQQSTAINIRWKPEGQTAKTVRKMSQLDRTAYYEKLQKHVLIWSGKYSGPKHHGSDSTLFLARGVVRRSPREFLNLLWDSSRTEEYNNFSLGRTDALILEDSFVSGGNSGAKVIKSLTKVPFTNLTVGLTALMHGKALGGNPHEGFVIVSRTLDSGMAGCHVGSTKRVEKGDSSEILLGVNIMRPVPGHDDLTDLLSVSQVNSSMVPQFLAFRLGMMGVEDFFSNVRKE